MKITHSIQYRYDTATGIELILCRQSRLSYPLHNHRLVSVLGIVLDGSIRLTIGQQTRCCEPDASFLISPYTPHILAADTPYSLLTVCIPEPILHQYSQSEIQNKLRALVSALPAVPITEQQFTYLFQALEHLPACDASPCCTAAPIADIKQRLERCPEQDFCIAEMAQVAFFSKYHFIRCFKQAVGLTPHQFQIQNRIRKAQHLLNESLSMTEVALAVGFFDQSHFIRQFKRQVGLTPTGYRYAWAAMNSGLSWSDQRGQKFRKQK